MYINRLKELRINAELLQKDICNVLNIKQQQYSRYENNQNDLPTSILIDLALYFNTSTDYILGLTDIKEPYKRSEK